MLIHAQICVIVGARTENEIAQVRNLIIYLHTGELKHLHVIRASLFHTEGIPSSLSLGYGEMNGDRSDKSEGKKYGMMEGGK